MATGRPMLSADESPCGAGVPPAGWARGKSEIRNLKSIHTEGGHMEKGGNR